MELCRRLCLIDVKCTEAGSFSNNFLWCVVKCSAVVPNYFWRGCFSRLPWISEIVCRIKIYTSASTVYVWSITVDLWITMSYSSTVLLFPNRLKYLLECTGTWNHSRYCSCPHLIVKNIKAKRSRNVTCMRLSLIQQENGFLN